MANQGGFIKPSGSPGNMIRFKMIASSYRILVHDGKILLLRCFNTGYEDGNYSLPAGHVEDDESLTQAGAREFFEEVGVRIRPTALHLVHVMHPKDNDIRIDFSFTAEIGDQQPVNKEPEKCDDLQWFPLKKLPTNTVGYIRHAIQCFAEKQFYSQRGW